jgi:hypothetical protein
MRSRRCALPSEAMNTPRETRKKIESACMSVFKKKERYLNLSFACHIENRKKLLGKSPQLTVHNRSSS